ncbi:lytic murein transglycosylase, partial [Undibacterium luofuense]
MLIARPSLLLTGLTLLLACSLHNGALAADKKVSKKPAKATSSTSSQQQENVHFEQWKEVEVFISQMVNLHGFEEEKLRQLFSQVRHVESARQLMKPAPPGKPKNWKVYRSRFVEPYRIAAGVQFWNQYAEALD